MGDVYSEFEQANASVPPKWKKIILVDSVTEGDVEVTIANGVLTLTAL